MVALSLSTQLSEFAPALRQYILPLWAHIYRSTGSIATKPAPRVAIRRLLLTGLLIGFTQLLFASRPAKVNEPLPAIAPSSSTQPAAPYRHGFLPDGPRNPSHPDGDVQGEPRQGLQRHGARLAQELGNSLGRWIGCQLVRHRCGSRIQTGGEWPNSLKIIRSIK